MLSLSKHGNVSPFDKLRVTQPSNRLIQWAYGIIMSGKSRGVKTKIGIFGPLALMVKIGNYGRKIKPIPRFSAGTALGCDSMGPYLS